MDNTSDADFIIFTCHRNDAAVAGGAQASVHYGSDLSNWPPAVHDGFNVITTVSNGSPDDTVTVRIRRALAPSGGLFARLKAQMPQP